MPSMLAWCGVTNRADSRCRRRYASSAVAGASASESMVVVTGTTRRPGSGRSPTSAAIDGTMAASAGRDPRPRWSVGYQTSSV